MINDNAVVDTFEDPRTIATRRLVQGILDQPDDGTDDRAMALAVRILQSSIGSNLPSRPTPMSISIDDNENRNETMLAWKRIEQRLTEQHESNITSTDDELLRRCQHLYHRFEMSVRKSSDQVRPQISTQLLVILSQLVHQGKRIGVSKSTSRSGPQHDDRPQFFHANKEYKRHNEVPSNVSRSSKRPIYENSNPELVLLQECFYCLQGISGDLLYFGDAANHYGKHSMLHLNRDRATKEICAWMDSRPPWRARGSSGAMDALRICGEAGFLCHRIQCFIDMVLTSSSSTPPRSGARETSLSAGAVAKALAVALQEQLQEYHSFLAQLESKMLRCVANDQQPSANASTSGMIPTIRWLYAELQAPTRQLYTMAMITDGLLPEGCCSIPLPAVYVLSGLYRHSRHGDVRHATLAQSLLAAAAQPWWNMLYAWTTMGLLLDDPYDEFFISASSRRSSASKASSMIPASPLHDDDRLLWHYGYQLDETKVPEGMLDRSLLTLSLNVGKCINFIRKCLGDTEWTLRWEATTTSTNNNADQSTNRGNAQQQQDLATEAITNTDLQQRLGFYHRPQRSSGSLNVPFLHHALRSASEQVHSHILHVLIDDHHLFHHLWALKQFLLLGQGDFISSLIEALQQVELEQRLLMPTAMSKDIGGNSSQWSQVFQKQTLAAIVDGALKSSNAKDLPPYVLERLQVEVVESVSAKTRSNKNKEEDDIIDEQHGDLSPSLNKSGDSISPITGGVWDGFLLEYVVPDQLLPIVQPETLFNYRLVFQFLFGLKTVEFRLDATWRQSAAIQHALQIHCQNNGIRLANNVGYSQATILLRNISITRQAMIHLVRNLKSYVMLDVLEGGWKHLVHRIETATTLDHVIEAHDLYLQDIVRKCWLLRTDSRSVGRKASKNHTSDIDSLAKKHWKTLLSLVNEFCAFQEEIFTESLMAAELAAEKRREADNRKDGQWVFQDEGTEEETFFYLADASKLLSVIRISEAFHKCVTKLLASLHEKINSPGDEIFDDRDAECPLVGLIDGQTDLDSLRFLTFQLDCNNFYGSI